jgi:hypothetical protein
MASARDRQASEVLGVRLPPLLRAAWLLPKRRVLQAARVQPQLLAES